MPRFNNSPEHITPVSIAGHRVNVRVNSAAINAISKGIPSCVNSQLIPSSVAPKPPGIKEAAPINKLRQ